MISRQLTVVFGLIFLLATIQVNAQSVASTLIRGKNTFEFAEEVLANPQQLVALSLAIESRFQMQGDYRGLSNRYAQNAGWFAKGPMGLEHIEVASEPTQHQAHGNYSITLRKLTFKECQFLANNRPIKAMFTSVQLNGKTVFGRGHQEQTGVLCDDEWFFQDGKNTIQYVGR
ncbi:hypothetical protein [Marinobacter sp.]|uniref:hypothetical protein n=1 Tax=Marinobacter sp. TaxID=50741 RepID=UPI003BAC80A3